MTMTVLAVSAISFRNGISKPFLTQNFRPHRIPRVAQGSLLGSIDRLLPDLNFLKPCYPGVS